MLEEKKNIYIVNKQQSKGWSGVLASEMLSMKSHRSTCIAEPTPGLPQPPDPAKHAPVDQHAGRERERQDTSSELFIAEEESQQI